MQEAAWVVADLATLLVAALGLAVVVAELGRQCARFLIETWREDREVCRRERAGVAAVRAREADLARGAREGASPRF